MQTTCSSFFFGFHPYYLPMAQLVPSLPEYQACTYEDVRAAYKAQGFIAAQWYTRAAHFLFSPRSFTVERD